MYGRSIVNAGERSVPCGASPPRNELTRPLPSNPLTGCWSASVPATGALPNASPSTVHAAVAAALEVREDDGRALVLLGKDQRPRAADDSRSRPAAVRRPVAPQEPVAERPAPCSAHDVLQPARRASPRPARRDVLRSVYCITVAGSAESAAFRGMNGEKASRRASTGQRRRRRYSTVPIGYSPQKRTPGKPRRSSVDRRSPARAIRATALADRATADGVTLLDHGLFGGAAPPRSSRARSPCSGSR